MNAVASGAPAYRDDKVARLRLLAAAVYRNQPHRAAEDERVAEITLVEADGAIDGGDAHAVAVVAHSGHDAFQDLNRVQHARRQQLGRRIGRGEAKDVGVANRPSPKAGAERIAD